VLAPNLTPGSARVLLISFDGVGADALDEFRTTGAVGENGYMHLVRNGLSGRVIPVNPTLTSAAHVSIATGTTPDVHGVVSNTFHAPGAPATEWASGYATTITAETIWEAARRQGKRTGIICFPGADGTSERRKGDWGLVWTVPVARSRVQTLTRSDFSAEWLPPGWHGGSGDSRSPVLHAKTEWTFTVAGSETKKEVVFSALDTTDDGRENYDRLIVRSGAEPIAVQNGWFPISTEATDRGETYRFGSWSKILAFDDQLKETTIYWGGIARNEGYPQSYRRMIDEQVGFWPSPPDERLASDWLEGKGGIPPEIFIEQVQRFSEFFTRATLASMRRMPWELVLAYQPIVDESEHQFRIENPRQPNFNERNVAAGTRVRAAAFEAFDRAVQQIASSVDFESTAMVVTSDHGLDAIDTQVSMNRLLADWGFATVTDDRVAAETPWAAYPSGHLAHIYEFGSQSGRTAELIRRLRELRAPDGGPVFERVAETAPGAHANSGRIVATAFPRFYLSGSARGPVFQPASHYGQHGALNTHRKLHTIFAAAGSRVTRGTIPQIQQTEIARYVSSLLGISAPVNAR
jgi:predicted AlkP superfamily pyrophosphatase or phosphodiesterase